VVSPSFSDGVTRRLRATNLAGSGSGAASLTGSGSGTISLTGSSSVGGSLVGSSSTGASLAGSSAVVSASSEVSGSEGVSSVGPSVSASLGIYSSVSIFAGRDVCSRTADSEGAPHPLINMATVTSTNNKILFIILSLCPLSKNNALDRRLRFRESLLRQLHLQTGRR